MSVLQRYKEYSAKLAQAIEESLMNETAESVKDVMRQKLDENVYSYPASPFAMSKRRYTDGGLADAENMIPQVDVGDSFVLTVANEAPFQHPGTAIDHTLSEVVQDGLKQYKQPYPRPFISDTESECIGSGASLAAFNEGMKKRGHDLESV